MMESKRSEGITNLAMSLAIAQGQIKTAKKDKVAKVKTKSGKDFEYRYSSFDAIWDVARKPLADNGLSVVQIPCNDKDGFYLETILMHASGEWISGMMTLPIVADRMSVIQSMGSAITYARRYMFGSMIGITVDDDDDGQRAARSQQRKQEPAKQKPVIPWQEEKPTKGNFFKRACDTFKLEVQDIADELKAANFDGYKPELAPAMWAALEAASAQPVTADATNEAEVDELAQDYPAIFDGDQPPLIEAEEPVSTHYSE